VVENRLRKEVESLNKKLAEKSEEARALTAKVCKLMYAVFESVL
jgi:hypothetical protein